MTPADPAGPPGRVLDDLPGFFAAPPGAPPALPAPPARPVDEPAHAVPVAGTPAGAAPAPDDPPGGPPATNPAGSPRGAPGGATAEAPPPDARARRGRPGRRGLVAAAVVVTAGAVAATVALGGRDGTADPSTAGSAGEGVRPDPTTSTGRTTTAPTTSAAPLTAAAAGDLAATDLVPGADGFSAEVSFAGVVLEPRAVGVTVAYPRVRVSGDGDATLAHVELEVWNCLDDAPPADPSAADCRRGLAEYADLPSPDLRAERTGDGVQLTGSFPTYTRPNGSAPVYTGRSYTLDVELRDRGGRVTGTLQLGDGQAAAEPGGTYTGR